MILKEGERHKSLKKNPPSKDEIVGFEIVRGRKLHSQWNQGVCEALLCFRRTEISFLPSLCPEFMPIVEQRKDSRRASISSRTLYLTTVEIHFSILSSEIKEWTSLCPIEIGT